MESLLELITVCLQADKSLGWTAKLNITIEVALAACWKTKSGGGKPKKTCFLTFARIKVANV